MTLPTFLEPENARITIPVALAAGYAIYHWWRWRMMHPKIVIEELPQPSPVPMPAGNGEVPPVAKAAAPSLGEGAEAGEKPAADAAEPRKGRWQARADRARQQAEFDAHAFSVRAHNWAFRKAMHGDPEWFVRLGEYAWRRGAMVESHYWITVAKAHGVAGLDDWLEHIRKRWIQAGRQLGDGRIYETFPRERMELANHYMMFACRFSAEVNRLWIEREAKSGNVDALRLLDILDK